MTDGVNLGFAEAQQPRRVKMKYLIGISALFMALSVQAKVIAESSNKGGGKMVVTDELCNDGKNKMAYSVMNGAQTLMGCWAYDDSYIHIRWYDGDLRSYPLENWILKTTKGNI